MSDRAFIFLLECVWLVVAAITAIECAVGRIPPEHAIYTTTLRLIVASIAAFLAGWIVNLVNPGQNLH